MKEGRICEWQASKGYGKINCNADLFRLHVHALPWYADQHSVTVGMKVTFRASAYQGHWQAMDVEIPALKKSGDDNGFISGEITNWIPEKGYGMIKPKQGKLIGINWRQCPAYADQYSIKKGMEVLFKVGEYNGKLTAHEVQIPLLQPQLGKRRKGHFSTWDVDMGFGMILAESGRRFRANWRELPNYAPQLTIEVGMQVIFKEGEFKGAPSADAMSIPCLIPPVGAKVVATDSYGEWDGMVQRKEDSNSLFIHVKGEYFEMTHFDKIVVTMLPVLKPTPQKKPKTKPMLPIGSNLSKLPDPPISLLNDEFKIPAMLSIPRPPTPPSVLQSPIQLQSPLRGASERSEPGAGSEPGSVASDLIDINFLPEGVVGSQPGMLLNETTHIQQLPIGTMPQSLNRALNNETDVLSQLFPSTGRGSKLRKYLPLFLEEEVDTVDIIQQLDHEQLMEIGVQSKLHRNRILLRIKQLFGSPIS